MPRDAGLSPAYPPRRRGLPCAGCGNASRESAGRAGPGTVHRRQSLPQTGRVAERDRPRSLGNFRGGFSSGPNRGPRACRNVPRPAGPRRRGSGDTRRTSFRDQPLDAADLLLDLVPFPIRSRRRIDPCHHGHPPTVGPDLLALGRQLVRSSQPRVDAPRVLVLLRGEQPIGLSQIGVRGRRGRALRPASWGWTAAVPGPPAGPVRAGVMSGWSSGRRLPRLGLRPGGNGLAVSRGRAVGRRQGTGIGQGRWFLQLPRNPAERMPGAGVEVRPSSGPDRRERQDASPRQRVRERPQWGQR